MIKKEITYLDFNQEVHTEDFYFHLKQDEIVELEMGRSGGLGAYLETMMKSDNRGEIIKAFKQMIRAAYGVRYGEKNEKFTKDPDIIKELGQPTPSEFLDSNAYSVLFMELVTSEKAAIEFIIGVVPAEIATDLDTDAIMNAAKAQVAGKGQVVDIKLPSAPLNVPPMSELKMPPSGVTAAPAQDDVPAAFRRPPVEKADRMIDPGAIELPEALQQLTRDEILAAYDRQMAQKRGENPPEPPAA